MSPDSSIFGKTFKTRKIVRTYTKEEINSIGVVNVEVEYDTRVKLLPMYILPGDGPILMGRDWFLALQVPTDLNYIDKKGEKQPIVQKLFDEFKGVFDGSLGTIKGVKANIRVAICCKRCRHGSAQLYMVQI